MPCSGSPGVPGCREQTGGAIVQIPRSYNSAQRRYLAFCRSHHEAGRHEWPARPNSVSPVGSKILIIAAGCGFKV